MRTEMSQKDIQLIEDMYKRGTKIQSIANKTDYPYYIVKGIIKDTLGSDDELLPPTARVSEKRPIEDKIEEAVDLYKRGYTTLQISKIENIRVNDLAKEFTIRNLDKVEYHQQYHPISISRLNKIRDNLVIGDKYRIIAEVYDNSLLRSRYRLTSITVTILEKYEHICRTDKGCFNYFDILKGQKIEQL